jgi:hypothetical protein
MPARFLALCLLPALAFANSIDIAVDGKPRLRYMHAFDTSTKELAHDTYKVFAHVLDQDGEPITKGPGGKFTHHRGIFIGWAKTGFQGKSYDTWHMKNSSIVHKETIEQKQDDKTSVLKVKLHWNTSEGVPILEEIRSFTVHHDGESYLLLDFVSELTAITDDVELNGDPEHAGMQYRPHNDVVGNKSAKYTFHKDSINTGNIKNERDVPWAAMTYKLRDKDWSVQHMNHPDNPKGTRHSCYRDYGRFGHFPVAKLAKGESLTLRYRIRVTEGEMPAAEALAKQYSAYVGG